MAKRNRIDLAREQLARWQSEKPTNYWEADGNIRNVLRMHMAARFDAQVEPLRRTGALSAGVIDELARLSNRDENLPLLDQYDGIGRRIDEVRFHPSYHALGAKLWSTGVLAALGEAGGEVACGARAYLLAHNGEAGHLCPVACTAGLIKLLQQVGSPAQRERYLAALLSTDYAERLHASQFVTEVQGGSDVGANDTVATPDPERPGMYRLTGEKWFCSVADAGVFVVTARIVGAPDGTAGLGLFIVRRRVDAGELNGFSIRRLKYKLGTRSMASGEIDFHGALAEPVGDVERGFKTLVSVVLDTSRVQNAVVTAGVMRRAYVEAHSFARAREAFGRPIIEHAMVQKTLARMRVMTSAAVASTFRIMAMTDRLAAGEVTGDAAKDLAAARRTHVNINKYWTSLWCTRAVRDGIEVLGGNGAIEEFSVLPRLYRDSIVLESWEGTHNTLCAQVLRDFAQRKLHQPWLREIAAALGATTAERVGEHHGRAQTLLADVSARIEQLLGLDAAHATLYIRDVVDQMCLLQAYSALLLELSWEAERGIASDKPLLVELYRRLFIDEVDPMQQLDLPELYRRASAQL